RRHPAAGQRLEAEGRHLPHGAGQQSLRPLPLVRDRLSKVVAMSRPILAVDVDGVISLFGFDEPPSRDEARYEMVDGMVHCISLLAGERLLRLAGLYDLVWATGWEDRANDYLPNILGLPELPFLTFNGAARFGSAHWKLGPLDEYGKGRPMAWV